jgi:hypothetical protein
MLFLLSLFLSIYTLIEAGDPLIDRRKRWDAMNWTQAEKDLEEGDDEEILETEDSLFMKEMEKRRNRGTGLMPPPEEVGLKDPTEWVKHSQAMSGPAMLFCTLKSSDEEGKPWENKTIEKVAFQWRELLKTGGLEASVYDITDKTSDKSTQPKFLVTTQSGWTAYEIRDFILERPEVTDLEWDQVKYTPADLVTIKADKGKKKVDSLSGIRDQLKRPAPTPVKKKVVKKKKTTTKKSEDVTSEEEKKTEL